MVSVRGVMFAAYPVNAPVGPSNPSQYPKQGPHQFEQVLLCLSCLPPLTLRRWPSSLRACAPKLVCGCLPAPALLSLTPVK